MNKHSSPDQQLPSAPTAPGATQPSSAEDAAVEAEMRRLSRRSFLWGALAIGGGLSGLRWLDTRRTENGIVWPLRRVLQSNEEIARDFFNPGRMAPTFAASRIDPERTNGDYGLSEDFDPSQWKLTVAGLADEEATSKEVTLAQIQKLPRIDMTTELKCIEGWSIIQHWTGARLSDFIAKYPPATISGEAFNLAKPDDWPAFVGLMTPDGAYYVGLEIEAALHPQTLLCYAMNGKPLTLEHGAPLRLVTPLKYGIKSLKRIGTLRYVNARPADYWAEQGYDYYAGH